MTLYVAKLTSIVSNGHVGRELNFSFGYGVTSERARNDLLEYLTRLGVKEVRIPKCTQPIKIYELEIKE